MRSILKNQLLALLIILNLGGLTSLEPVLHNHVLDLHGEHKECLSCGWTQISIDQAPIQSASTQDSYKEFSYKTQEITPHASRISPSRSRAPPILS